MVWFYFYDPDSPNMWCACYKNGFKWKSDYNAGERMVIEETDRNHSDFKYILYATGKITEIKVSHY